MKNINRLENYFLRSNQPIVYIQHINHTSNATFFEENTDGMKLHGGLQLKRKSIVIEKYFPNSFFQTNLESKLHKEGVEQVIITEMMTHMCIDSTTRASNELGFHPVLIADATATKELQVKGEVVSAQSVQLAFISALTNFSRVETTKDFLKDVLQK